MSLVVASIVPLLIFILGYEYSEYREDIAATGQETVTMARGLALLVEEQLKTHIAALQTLAISRTLQAGDLDAFRAQADIVVARQFPGANIVLLRQDGQMLMSTRVPPGAPLPSGANFGSSRQVFANGEPIVSDVFAGAVTHLPVVAIVVPVSAADGTITYALSMSPRLEAFADLVRRQKFPDGWVVSLFDRQGAIVARVPNGDRFIGQKASSSFIGPLLKEREGTLESTSLEGTQLVSGFSHGEQFGWSVGIGVPRADLIAPVVASVTRTCALGILLLAASLLFGFYLARRIAGPIDSLRRLAIASDAAPLVAPASTGLPEVDEVANALHTAERERRRSREAEIILRDGIETIPEGFSIYDDEDRLVMCNKAYRRLSGDVEAEIAPGMRYEDFLRTGAARGRYVAAIGQEEEWIAARLREHRDPAGVIEQELNDGGWVLITKHRLSNGWTAGLRIDITGLKQAERGLRDARRHAEEAEAFLRDAIEGISGGLIVTDTEDRLILFNRQYHNYYSDCTTLKLGAPYQDFLRERIQRGYYPQARGREEAWFDEVMARHADASNEIEIQLPSGRWLLLTERRMSNGGIAGVSLDITALKTAETDLRRSEEQFRRVFETSQDLIVVTDSRGTLIRISPIAMRMLGYDPQELAGRRGEVLVHPDDLDGVRDRMRAARRGGITQNFECRYVHKNGRAISLWWTGAWSASERQYFFIGRDMTERNEAERRLRQSEERFRRVVEAVPNAILTVSRDGTIEMVNAQAERIFGYTRQELLNAPVESLLPPHLRDRHPALRSGFFTEPEARPMGGGRDLYAVRKDGREFPVEVGLNPLETETGTMVLASVIDITERKQNEQKVIAAQRRAQETLVALRRGEEQLNRAQQLAQMGSDTRNLQTDEAEWSDESYRIFGVSRESYVPSTENFLAMVHPDDREKVLATREQVAQGIAPAPFEYRITRPDGSLRHIYRENQLIKDESGKPLYLVGTIHDVTERRQTEEQLRQAQKMEAIGNLTGGMAHDFNNLLGIIVGNLGLAGERLSGDPDIEEMVRESLDAAWRGADLTRRLLAFARRQPLRPAKIEVNELITDTARLLRRLLGEDIEVRLNLAGDVWSVTADPAQLEASLANLATNARDAMPKGGHLIIATGNRHLDADYAATHAEASEGDFVMIEVSDTGSGMSADVMSHIFEPFYTTKEAGKGTGLGLSMVFGFLRQSEGHVSVYSEPGVGTTFRLYLPRSTGEAIAPEDLRESIAEHGAGETVLVVEDNQGVRRTVVRQLRDLGYKVLETERVAEALEVLQREAVDLLFTDIIMPGGLDGVELAHLARERWPGLKIVLTSGFPQTRIDLADAPMLGLRLISKPYSKEELAAVLRATLSE